MINDEELLNKNGWEIECQSPFEIRHKNGSFATMDAAYIIVSKLKMNDIISDDKIYLENSCSNIKKTTEEIIKSVLKALDGEKSAQCKSTMIRLTPQEIKNIMELAAKYWYNAKSADTPLSMKEVIEHHYEVAFGILKVTDPDRFENLN